MKSIVKALYGPYPELYEYVQAIFIAAKSIHPFSLISSSSLLTFGDLFCELITVAGLALSTCTISNHRFTKHAMVELVLCAHRCCYS